MATLKEQLKDIQPGETYKLISKEQHEAQMRFTATMLCLRFLEFVCLIILAVAVWSISDRVENVWEQLKYLSSQSEDRRDVNRDGKIDIVDLSVLAAEINASK